MSASPASAAFDEREPPYAGRGGDDDAFRRLVEPHLTELRTHCYRMLGSLHDAEDALQDTLLRAWRGMKRFDQRRPPRPWLYKIATNVCLSAIEQRSRRVASVDEPADGKKVLRWIEPYPDAELGVEAGYASPEARYEQREALELAFIIALQHLSRRQRAVLILRDVLGYSAKEVGETLSATPASVNSALQRARNALAQELPQPSQQATLRSLGERRVRHLVDRFVNAFERGDASAIVALLAEDAKFSMPPCTRLYRGRKAIAGSWFMPEGGAGALRFVLTRANGQLAFGAYRLDPEARSYIPIALDVLAVRGKCVTEIAAFRAPEIFGRFGLPATLSV
jgi:RNA polymerase sigma-70 factor, ECF subfamily